MASAMTFADAVVALIDGGTVRRSAWGPRRAVRLDVAGWSGKEDLLMVDLHRAADFSPYPYHPTAEDVRGADWVEVSI